MKGPRVFEVPSGTIEAFFHNADGLEQFKSFIDSAKDELGPDWWIEAEERYGFAYECQHGGSIDPTCQEVLSNEAQAELTHHGKLPEKGLVRMCGDCWNACCRRCN
jgi:hypothetical protein